MSSLPGVGVSGRGEARVRGGHAWIYRSDLTEATASGGDIVAVFGPRRRVLGQALYSDRSEIALRMISRTGEPVDAAFWRARLAAAIAYRDRLGIDATAWRLVHGEGDLLPSLVVDRYGDYLVLQSHSQAMDRLQPLIAEILVELVRPAGVLARNDARVRRFEALPSVVAVLHGEVPEQVMVREGGVEYLADLTRGQKTGLFLDQRENRLAAAGYAGGRVLDCFTYQGGFALHLARVADHVVAVDASEEAVGRLDQNARHNGIRNLTSRVANVFDLLRDLEREGERFDTIVLDPPAFAKNRAAIPGALAGYKEINLRALKLLRPGGILITCSCSYHMGPAAFEDVLRAAAADARVSVTLAERRMQSRDHPVLLGVPETLYLKCLIGRRQD